MGRDKLGGRVKIQKLQYIKQIINKDLLCSTDNSIQYSGIELTLKKKKNSLIP